MKQNFPLFYPHFLSTCCNCNFCGKKQPSIVLKGLKIEIKIVFRIDITCEMILSSSCQLTDTNKMGRNSKKNTLYIDFGWNSQGTLKKPLNADIIPLHHIHFASRYQILTMCYQYLANIACKTWARNLSQKTALYYV